MNTLTFVLLGAGAVFCVIVLLVVGALLLRADDGSKPDAAPANPAKPPQQPSNWQPNDQHDGDEEITILAVQPMLLDRNAEEGDLADSQVTEDIELGKTHPIVHDTGAADEEPSAAAPLILVSAVGQTNKGRRRKNNEDAFVVLEQYHTFVVADGMGGYAGGEVASQTAVDTIREAFETHNFAGTTGDLPTDGAQLSAAIQMANRAIWEKAQTDPELTGMGTTIVGARFSPRKERVYIGHVGDSRLYRVRSGKLEQVTRDHTLASHGVEGPLRHQLTRAAGIAPGIEVDLIMARPEVGDVFLLCSDGLTKMVKDKDIEAIINAYPDTATTVQGLIAKANNNGGKDNITVILVKVTNPSDPEVTQSGVFSHSINNDGQSEQGLIEDVSAEFSTKLHNLEPPDDTQDPPVSLPPTDLDIRSVEQQGPPTAPTEIDDDDKS